MKRLIDPVLTGPNIVTCIDAETGEPVSFDVAGDNGQPGNTIYGLRALYGDGCISDETWVQCRDLCAAPAPKSNPRADNNPAVAVNVDDVIDEAPAPVAPPEAPAPRAKRGK